MFDLNGKEIFTEKKLEMHIAVQFSVPRKYNPKDYFGGNYLVIEQQSARFLRDYLSDKFTFTPQAYEVLSRYLRLLKHSKYAGIRQNIKQALAKFKEDQKRSQEAMIQKQKDEEKVRAYAAAGFTILNKKRVARNLTSSQLLLLGELLSKVKDRSTVRLKSKLQNYALLKIKRTISGEILADEDFVKLVNKYGSPRDCSYIAKRLNNNQPLAKTPVVVENTPKHQPKQKVKSKKVKSHKFGSFIRSIGKKAKRVAIVTGIVLLGVIGGKSAFDAFNRTSSSEKSSKPKVENVAVTNQTPIVSEANISETTELTSKEQQLEKAYKNRFDSSLEILIGAEKRDALYAEVDQLARDGKIEFKDGTTREWYAHAFTMYDKVAPFSSQNQLIKQLRAGESVSKQDVHALVIQSGRNGAGVKGTAEYSAFDHADSSLQQKHMSNHKEVKMAQLAMNASAGR